MSTRKIFFLLLCMLMGMQANALTLKGISASHKGNNGEEFTKLFDGSTDTKWCFNTNGDAYVIFSTLNEDAISISGYKLATAGDDATFTGRRPKSWVLYGSNDKSAWTTIDSRDNSSGNLISAVNKTFYTFNLAAPSDKYKYFRLSIPSAYYGTTIQMSEVQLIMGGTCDHPSTITKKVGSCTNGGSHIQTLCSLCEEFISQTETCTAHVPHVVDGLEDGSCEMCNDILCMSADGYMEIDNLPKWNAFAAAMATGKTNLNARLTADISGVTTPVSSFYDWAYRGTFDGGGHTLDMNLVADVGEFALFRFTNGATIKNVHLTGTIDGGEYQFVASLVGYASGSTVIQQVWSSVAITTPRDGDGTYAGIISRNNNANTSAHNTIIENCLFDGSITGAKLYANAGIAGFLHNNSNASVANCLVVANMQTMLTNCATITRNTSNNAVTITNCYYGSALKNYGTTNGTEASDEDLRSGAIAFSLNGNTDAGVWGQAIGEGAYPVPITTDAGKVYKHEEDGYIYYTNTAVLCEHQFSSEPTSTVAATCSQEGYDVYVCEKCHFAKKDNIVAADESLHVWSENGYCTACGKMDVPVLVDDEEDPYNGYYRIANAANLVWFAEKVNSSTDNAKLNAVVTADINLDGIAWTPIASQSKYGDGEDANGYRGTFDGGNFKISNLKLDPASKYTALIGKTYDAVVKNVSISGATGSTGYSSGRFLGSLIGYARKTNVTDCHVTGVDLTAYYVGGLVGAADSCVIDRCTVKGAITGSNYGGGVVCKATGESSIKNCSFAGKGYKHFAGLVAMAYKITVSNCYTYAQSDNLYYSASCFVIYLGSGESYFKNCHAYLNGITKEADSNTQYFKNENSRTYTVPEHFANGTVLRYLATPWGQKVGTDPLPVLDGARNAKYINIYAAGQTVSKIENSLTYDDNEGQALLAAMGTNDVAVTNDPALYAVTNVLHVGDNGEYLAKELNIEDGQAFGLGADITAESATYTRNVSNGNYQSLVLPFAANKTNLEDAGYTDFYTINNVLMYDDDNDGVFDRTELEVLRVTKTDCVFRAGYPYIFKGQGSHAVTQTGEVTVVSKGTSVDCSNVLNKYTFVPTLTGVTGEKMYSGGYYAMAGGALKQAADNTVALSPFRWYLEVTSRTQDQVDAAASASRIKQININVIGEETNIGTRLYNDDQRERIDVTYDLTGRRVKDGGQGIRIVGGKKVLLKK